MTRRWPAGLSPLAVREGNIGPFGAGFRRRRRRVPSRRRGAGRPHFPPGRGALTSAAGDRVVQEAGRADLRVGSSVAGLGNWVRNGSWHTDRQSLGTIEA